tara:strand:+ start:231 stop:788 length:558 start_codon:yes stop_codon:yes gene_type:complete
MKRLTFIFIFYSSFVFSQEEINIIYIDNNATVSQFDTIQSRIDALVTSDFLLYISDGSRPKIINDRTSYNNIIRETLLEKTDRPTWSYDIRYLNNSFKEFIGDKLAIGEGVKNNTLINFYFFFDKETFCMYDLHQDFVTQILLIYKLRTQEGINENCKVTYNIYTNTDNKCIEKSDDKQLIINEY